jgi:PBP1b-binding outer membrane lipoprotein LpoB
MKNLFLSVAVTVFIFAGCSGNSRGNQENVDAAEIEQMESVTMEIDSTISDIESTAGELDSILREI